RAWLHGSTAAALGRCRRAVRCSRRGHALTASTVLPLLVLLSSLAPGLVIFFLPEDWRRTRTALNLTGAIVKVLLVALIALGIADDVEYAVSFPLAGNAELALVI